MNLFTLFPAKVVARVVGTSWVDMVLGEDPRKREQPGHRGVSNDLAVCVSGADDGNRTRVISLGS